MTWIIMPWALIICVLWVLGFVFSFRYPAISDIHRFENRKLEALQKHFLVYPPAGRNANIITKCNKCGHNFSITEDGGPYDTTICPHCLHIDTSFQRIVDTKGVYR